MNDRIKTLKQQILDIEDEFKSALRQQKPQVLYRFNGAKIEFEHKVKLTQRKFKIGLLRWLHYSQPRHLLSAPFIYGMIVPMLILDLSISLFQHICFRLYKIPIVIRSDFILIDRHHLAYLNSIEKLNCVYCGYGNGLLSYGREIASRTEQYWCPIKHAQSPADPPPHYIHYIDYGDHHDYHARLKKYRCQLSEPQVINIKPLVK